MILRKKKEIEYCVLCHKDTGYTKDTPIHERKYYIEGSGQLGESCYAEVYSPLKPFERREDIYGRVDF